MTEHKFLLIKKKENLEDYESLLYNAYSTKVKNILLIASKLTKKEFDPVKELFWGLDSMPQDEPFNKRYRAILEITEYFHAAKGQRGKFLEKILASKSETGICSIRLSEIPIWFEIPQLFGKKKIFGDEKLTKEEKKEIKKLAEKWKFLGDKDENIDFDIGNIDKNVLILFEQKNRVDSGGTSARREIFSAKVMPLLKKIKSDKKLFELNDEKREKLNFEELMNKLKVNSLYIFDGILFNKNGTSATVEGDKTEGFYSSRKSEYRETIKFFEDNKEHFKVLKTDESDLSINIKVKDSDLKIEMGVAYGDDIPKKLLNLDFSLHDTIISGFDDLWLAFKIGIDERELLEKEGNNNIQKLIDLSEEGDFKNLCNQLRDNEGDEETLSKIIDFIKSKNIIEITDSNKEYFEDLILLLVETKII